VNPGDPHPDPPHPSLLPQWGRRDRVWWLRIQLFQDDRLATDRARINGSSVTLAAAASGNAATQNPHQIHRVDAHDGRSRNQFAEDAERFAVVSGR